METTKTHIFTSLKSSYLTNLIFSFAFHLNEALQILSLISKKGERYIGENLAQLQSFCISPTKREIVFNLDQNCFKRQQPYKIVDKVTFLTTSLNLHLVKDFAKGSLGFGLVHFGNNEFILDHKENPDINRENIETLYSILGKTKTLQLNRLYKTYEVLEVIANDPQSFQNLEGMILDFDKNYIDLIIKSVGQLINLKELGLNQTFFDTTVEEYEQTAVKLIKMTTGLKKLTLFPKEGSSMAIVNQCVENLTDLEELNILLSDTKDELMSDADIFQQFQKLKKLQIIGGIVNQTGLRMFPQLQELDISTFREDNSVLLSDFAHLTKLTLHTVDQGIVERLFNVLGQTKRLRELTIDFPLKEYQVLERFLSDNKSVETLKLIKINPINFNFIVGLGQNQTLKSLTLEMLRVKKEYIQCQEVPLFNGLQNNTLKQLTIKGSAKAKFMDIFSPQYFSSMLRMFQGLNMLEIFNLQFSSKVVKVIIDPICENQSLSSLIFTACLFEQNSFKVLLDSIKTKKVKFLQFNKCEIKDPQMQEITSLIENNPYIQRIDLQFSEMNFQETFLKFLEAVGAHPQLKYIDLMHSKIGYSANIEHLQLLNDSILRNCRNLQYLHIEDTKTQKNEDILEMKNKMIRNFYENLPNLQEIKF